MNAHDDRLSPARRIAVLGVATLAVVSVVSWRSGTIFSGAVDTVVVAKAVLSCVALLGAVALAWRSRPLRPPGLRTVTLLAIVVGISCVGALASGAAVSTFIVAARIGILTATLLALLACTPWRSVLGSLLAAMGAVACIAAVTGMPSFFAEGRLAGGIPEMQENELAGLAAAPLLALLVRMFRDGLTWYVLTPAVVLAVIVVATGSRTALLAFGVATIVALVVAPRLHWSALVAILATIPAAFAIVAFTGVLSDFIVRGQTADELSTLSSRTDAWQVVLAWDPGSWQRWLGVGLSVKEIAVDHPWREVQVFDSSWVSLLAQTGALGAAVVLVWMLATTRDIWTYRDARPLLLPLLVFIVVRGVTENGLVDASTTFLLLVTLSVAAEPATRSAAPAAASGLGPAFTRAPARYLPPPVPLTREGATT